MKELKSINVVAPIGDDLNQVSQENELSSISGSRADRPRSRGGSPPRVTVGGITDDLDQPGRTPACSVSDRHLAPSAFSRVASFARQNSWRNRLKSVLQETDRFNFDDRACGITVLPDRLTTSLCHEPASCHSAMLPHPGRRMI